MVPNILHSAKILAQIWGVFFQLSAYEYYYWFNKPAYFGKNGNHCSAYYKKKKYIDNTKWATWIECSHRSLNLLSRGWACLVWSSHWCHHGTSVSRGHKSTGLTQFCSPPQLGKKAEQLFNWTWERERETDRQTETETDRQTEVDTEREREREREHWEINRDNQT